MANPALTPVEFHGTTLTITAIENAPFVAMRPICEAIGLQWEGQLQRIKRHPVLSTCVCVTHMQMPGDDQAREVVMFPLDKLNGWLFGVTVSRIKPELRERLTVYQRECFDVLASHFGAKQPPSALLPSDTPMNTNPEPGPSMPFSLDALIAFIGSGLMNRDALLRIANASGMALHIDVCNSASQHTGWGDAVAKQITHDLPITDLNAIVTKATQELWVRNIEVPAAKPVPKRSQFSEA